MADKHKLAQVIRNMVSNAIKFTPENGDVTVKCHVIPELRNNDTAKLRVEVQDTGAGISKVGY